MSCPDYPSRRRAAQGLVLVGARMKESLSPGTFRVGGGLGPAKLWIMNRADLNWPLLKGVLEDPLWSIRAGLTYKQVEVWGYARAQ
eukprot:3614182-Pyramimonas_sp.AAC.1